MTRQKEKEILVPAVSHIVTILSRSWLSDIVKEILVPTHAITIVNYLFHATTVVNNENDINRYANRYIAELSAEINRKDTLKKILLALKRDWQSYYTRRIMIMQKEEEIEQSYYKLSDIADILGMPSSNTHRHLRILSKYGLFFEIAKIERPDHKILFPSPILEYVFNEWKITEDRVTPPFELPKDLGLKVMMADIQKTIEEGRNNENFYKAAPIIYPLIQNLVNNYDVLVNYFIINLKFIQRQKWHKSGFNLKLIMLLNKELKGSLEPLKNGIRSLILCYIHETAMHRKELYRQRYEIFEERVKESSFNFEYYNNRIIVTYEL